MEKYQLPREGVVRIDVLEIDRMLNLPDDLRVVAVVADQFPPSIKVLLAGERMPERHLDAEPEWVYPAIERCACGHRRFVWDNSNG